MTSSTTPSGAVLRVLTMNLWGVARDLQRRTVRFVALVADLQPDVVLMQELVAPGAAEYISTELGQEYWFITDQDARAHTATTTRIEDRPWWTWFPVLCVVVLAGVCNSVCVLACACVVSPPALPYLAGWWLWPHSSTRSAFVPADLSGRGFLVRKARFPKKPVVLLTSTFARRGYNPPFHTSKEHTSLKERWVMHSALCPGFTVLHLGEVRGVRVGGADLAHNQHPRSFVVTNVHLTPDSCQQRTRAWQAAMACSVSSGYASLHGASLVYGGDLNCDTTRGGDEGNETGSVLRRLGLQCVSDGPGSGPTCSARSNPYTAPGFEGCADRPHLHRRVRSRAPPRLPCGCDGPGGIRPLWCPCRHSVAFVAGVRGGCASGVLTL